MKLKVKTEGNSIPISGNKIIFIETKIVPINSIKLWDKNPRKNDGAVKKLSEIIKHHGQVSSIIVWDKDMTIYKGNTTWKALKLLDKKECRIDLVSFPSEVSAIAYAIDDNKASEMSAWDEDVLLKLMQSEKLDIKSFSEKEIEIFSNIDKLVLQDDQALMNMYSVHIKCLNKEEQSVIMKKLGIKKTFGVF
jgi:hypothetical protein